MKIVLVTGGARSGKSSYVEARAIALGGDCVTFIATATATDDDMRDRIARHRALRPAPWETLENKDAQLALRLARHDIVVIDCITLLVASTIGGASSRSDVDAASDAAISALLRSAASRGGTLLLVSNEVGMSVHPPTALGLWFQDALGRANQRIAADAEEVVLMVSGVPLVIKRPAS